MHHVCISVDQPVRILANGRLCVPMFRITKIGKEDVVHLKIPAPGVIKSLYSLAICDDEVVHQDFDIVPIGPVANILDGCPEVTAARSRD